MKCFSWYTQILGIESKKHHKKFSLQKGNKNKSVDPLLFIPFVILIRNGFSKHEEITNKICITDFELVFIPLVSAYQGFLFGVLKFTRNSN